MPCWSVRCTCRCRCWNSRAAPADRRARGIVTTDAPHSVLLRGVPSWSHPNAVHLHHFQDPCLVRGFCLGERRLPACRYVPAMNPKVLFRLFRDLSTNFRDSQLPHVLDWTQNHSENIRFLRNTGSPYHSVKHHPMRPSYETQNLNRHRLTRAPPCASAATSTSLPPGDALFLPAPVAAARPAGRQRGRRCVALRCAGCGEC